MFKEDVRYGHYDEIIKNNLNYGLSMVQIWYCMDVCNSYITSGSFNFVGRSNFTHLVRDVMEGRTYTDIKTFEKVVVSFTEDDKENVINFCFDFITKNVKIK